MSRHVMSCHVLSCHVMSCHLTSCHVMSWPVISRLVMSSHVFSCLSRLVISCHVMSCHVILLDNLAPGFLNSSIMAGGVAPTRFSKPWPCAGIRLGATLSLWRRAHCERVRGRRAHFFHLGIVLRGRLRGSGVLRACWEVCRGCVAALCRGDWVPGAFCIRIVKVRFAWQAAGIVWLGACPERARGPCWRRSAVGIGFWACRARAHDFTRCHLRFAWQVWDFGCIDVLGKALDGGSAWQAQ